MCGIIYVSRKNGAAAKTALKRYIKQQDRGSNGFGVVAWNASGLTYKRFMHEADMRTAVKLLPHENILLHHRFPTSVVNLPETAHPIRVKNRELSNEYYLLHNGHISNDMELHEKHLALGYRYSTEIETRYVVQKRLYYGSASWNDSEALGIELARAIEGKSTKVDAKGAIAYMILQVKRGKPIALYYGTNGGNPLTRLQKNDITIIASEGYAPIAANIGYRLDLATQTETQSGISLISQPATHSRGYSDTEYKWGHSTMTYKSGKTATELEMELEEIEDMIAEAQERYHAAIEKGDDTAEADANTTLAFYREEYSRTIAQLETALLT